MKWLKDVHLFLQIARARNLSEAAQILDMSPAALSAALRRLEAHSGLKLVQRTTRDFRLTAEGRQFLAHCTQALQSMEDARRQLLDAREQVSGWVRLSMPSDLGRNVVLPLLRQFRALHPQVQLRVQLEDRLASVQREEVDVVLRYGQPPPTSSMVMLPVCPDNRRVLVASPAYVARHGAPASPQALAQHECLCFMRDGRLHRTWQFSQGDRVLAVPVQGSVVSNDGEAIRQLALAGDGIAYKAQLDVTADVQAGRLVPLCTDWQGEAAPLFMGCADRTQWQAVQHRLRTFLVLQLQQLQAHAIGANA